MRPGYEGPFFAEADLEFVCEKCLIAGKLGGADATTNEGGWEALCQQIKEAHPKYVVMWDSD